MHGQPRAYGGTDGLRLDHALGVLGRCAQFPHSRRERWAGTDTGKGTRADGARGAHHSRRSRPVAQPCRSGDRQRADPASHCPAWRAPSQQPSAASSPHQGAPGRCGHALAARIAGTGTTTRHRPPSSRVRVAPCAARKGLDECGYVVDGRDGMPRSPVEPIPPIAHGIIGPTWQQRGDGAPLVADAADHLQNHRVLLRGPGLGAIVVGPTTRRVSTWASSRGWRVGCG